MTKKMKLGVACALAVLALACSKDKDKEAGGTGGSAAAVDKYKESSIDAEAKNALGQIAKDMSKAYEQERMGSAVLAQGAQTAITRSLCGSAKPVPSSLAAVTDKKYQSSPAEWNEGAATGTGFACLKFAMDQPQYFQYEVVTEGAPGSAGAKFTAYARRVVGKELHEFSVQGVVGKDLALAISPSIREEKKPAP